ncbi:MAG: hypothetical protein EBR09_09660, partial [Proteobacteria bacterium]|nr:hypothetical protein [Pseudomonadota bacterium]
MSTTGSLGASGSATVNIKASAGGTFAFNTVLTDSFSNTSNATNTTGTAVLTRPIVTIGTPTPTTANYNDSINFPITVTGSSAVNLLQANVTPTYTGGVACTVAVTNGTTASPTVTLSACTNSGSVNITLAANIAQDAAGNTSVAAGPSANVTVTNTPPTLTLTAPAANAQLGAATFNLQGTCETGLTVTVTSADLAPASVSQTCSATGGGSFSIPVQLAGAEGNKNALVTSQNAAGLVSTVSRTFLKDTVAPEVSISAPSATTVKQSSAAVTYTVTFTDSNTLNAIVLSTLTTQITLTGTPVCSKSVAANGAVPNSYIVSLSNCTGNGTVGISVAASAASDAAGNASPATNSGTTFTVDNTPPAVSIATAGATITTNPVTTALNGGCENGLTVTLGGDVTAGQTTTCASNAFIFASWSVTSGTGTKSVTVSQTDAAGNVGTSSAVSFNLQNGWYQEAYIKASNAGAGDFFGYSVSLSGDTLAVGARGEDSSQATITNGADASADNSATAAGGVYVYRRSGTSWVQEAYLKASNAEANDEFGFSVSISGDSLAVSARGEDSNQTSITNGTAASANNSASYAGAVYVYRRSGTSWAQEAYIKAANANSNDYFGVSVTISGDTLAVGADFEASNQTTITNGAGASADNSASSAGAVYVYRRDGSTWAQEAYMKAANTRAGVGFGKSVSLSGESLAVGAAGEDSNQTTITNGTTASSDISASAAGAVYVYRRSGTNWAQEAYVKASNAESGDNFGLSVSLSGDTLAVGTKYEASNQTNITNGNGASSNNSANSSGAVYVYRRSGTNWAQEAFVKASNTEAFDYFGTSVSLSGESLAVGATGEASNQNTITSGTAASSDNSASAAGAVYVYRRNGTHWAQEAYVKAANARSNTNFGDEVSLSGDTLAVGVPNEDSNQTTITNGTTASSDNSAIDSGAVYIYRHRDRMFDPDIRVTGTTTTSITFAWSSNLGTATQVMIAPVSNGTWAPPADCAGGVIRSGTTSSFVSLAPGNKYGIRVCAWDGTNASGGTTIWADTEPVKWYQEAYVKASNADSGDFFGWSVSLSGDTLAVG